MILSFDDIPGADIMVWAGLTFMFYLASYLMALNIIDDITKNSLAKIPFLLAAALPTAFIMAILNYQPIFLLFLMAVSNYFRVKKLAEPGNKRFQGMNVSPPLFYIASYLYIFLACGLGYYLQLPVESEGQILPYWETLIPRE